MKTILLAGPSASGKSTLARALCQGDRRYTISTSAYLRGTSGARTPGELFEVGNKLDNDNPAWLQNLVANDPRNIPAVVDAVRSHAQYNSFPESEVITVNVYAGAEDLATRHLERNTQPVPTPWMFNRPDFVWNSSTTSLASALTALEQMSGGGVVDVVIGGQYGSEGKGKLCALLAPNYDVLVRSGGPNAGHWVREEDWEYCYHHLPSGTRSNPRAMVYLAAGAGFNPGRLLEEIGQCDAQGRIRIDENAVAITDEDREFEQGDLVKSVGSTAQGVGAAQARRVMRGMHGLVNGPRETLGLTFPHGFKGMDAKVSRHLATHLQAGDRVMLEGTQGSELSLYHGPYPWVTSRDTNVSGLLAEVGLPPSCVRDTWLVVRSYPIRVGGNSGPMFGELTWDQVAQRAGLDDVPALMRSELTSTTKRQRRVGEFDWHQFERAVALNRPTRLFLTFADYLSPRARGVRTWQDLPSEVTDFCDKLSREAGCPVAGVSTGRMQADTVIRRGYVR